MNKAINFTNEKFKEFEKDLKKKEEKFKFLEKENDYLNKRLEKMDAVVDRQEQYSRSNFLLVHRIVEEKLEDTNEQIINTLQQSKYETVKPEDFDRLYRLDLGFSHQKTLNLVQ